MAPIFFSTTLTTLLLTPHVCLWKEKLFFSYIMTMERMTETWGMMVGVKENKNVNWKVLFSQLHPSSFFCAVLSESEGCSGNMSTINGIKIKYFNGFNLGVKIFFFYLSFFFHKVLKKNHENFKKFFFESSLSY